MIQIAKPLVGKEELEEIRRVFESRQLAQGDAVKEFEEELARYQGYRHCVSTSSGTAALHVALVALGVGAGDEVIVPDFSFISTAATVRLAGAQPVFVDVRGGTFNINVDAVAKAITPKTKAVIPVSLYGQPYDVDALRELCEDKGLRVVSDNCQAIGAEFNGSRNFKDDFAALSFYPTKNMTTAEGGALLTDDDALAEKTRLLCNIGQKRKYDYALVGYNYRMSSVHAAIGIAQLRKLDEWIEKRRANAALLNGLLEVEPPFVDSSVKHVYHQYTIKLDGRDEVQRKLREAGIGASVYYPAPLHSLSVFNSEANCPVTEELCKTVLSLPVHPALTKKEVREVASKFNECISSD